MTTYELEKMFRRASLLEVGAAKAYIYAKITGAINEIPSTEKIIDFTDEETNCGYVIQAMDDYFVAVDIYRDKDKNADFYIYEDGLFINVLENIERYNNYIIIEDGAQT